MWLQAPKPEPKSESEEEIESASADDESEYVNHTVYRRRSPFFKMAPKIFGLRCVLHPRTEVAWCKTRLESRKYSQK